MLRLGCCDCDESVAVAVPVPGPPGPPGSGTGGANYIHTQAVASSSWTVTHSLGQRPVDVTVWSLDYGTQWTNVQIEPLNSNQVRLWFDGPQTGIALVHT